MDRLVYSMYKMPVQRHPQGSELEVQKLLPWFFPACTVIYISCCTTRLLTANMIASCSLQIISSNLGPQLQGLPAGRTSSRKAKGGGVRSVLPSYCAYERHAISTLRCEACEAVQCATCLTSSSKARTRGDALVQVPSTHTTFPKRDLLNTTAPSRAPFSTRRPMPDTYMLDEVDHPGNGKHKSSEGRSSYSNDTESPSRDRKGSQASPTGAETTPKKKRKVNHGRKHMCRCQTLADTLQIACVYCRRSVSSKSSSTSGL
jgi:hypothetical protein